MPPQRSRNDRLAIVLANETLQLVVDVGDAVAVVVLVLVVLEAVSVVVLVPVEDAVTVVVLVI